MGKKKSDSCYTYFKIVGQFEVDEISKILGLEPCKSWKASDLRRDGKPFGFSLWKYGYNNDYNPYVSEMMEKTIKDLEDKIPQLLKIKEIFDVKFYLTVVPSVYSGTIHPALSPSIKVMEFCVKTMTKLDIDLYVY